MTAPRPAPRPATTRTPLTGGPPRGPTLAPGAPTARDRPAPRRVLAPRGRLGGPGIGTVVPAEREVVDLLQPVDGAVGAEIVDVVRAIERGVVARELGVRGLDLGARRRERVDEHLAGQLGDGKVG